MENSILLNLNNTQGVSLFAKGESAELLTCIVAGCIIVFTAAVIVKILK